MREIVYKRSSAWLHSYRMLAEYRVVTSECPGISSPWRRTGDEVAALSEILAAGGDVPISALNAAAEGVIADAQASLPTDPSEFGDRTYALFVARRLVEGQDARDIGSEALLGYIRYGDDSFPIVDSTFSSKGGTKFFTKMRRLCLYTVIHCPCQTDSESLFGAIEGVPNALHQRWAIHGGLDKSPSHDFSLPIQDFITAALQISERAGRRPSDWGTQLNNDLKDLEDEVRENKRKFPRPSGALGDDARDRILAQLAEVRAFLEPHLAD